MKNFYRKTKQKYFEKPENLKEKEKLLKMEDFYKRHFESSEEKVKKISLENLQELKEEGITTENFLDYLCQEHKLLLHGSIHKISGDKLKSSKKKIFASNKAAIAIMKSLYSGGNVNLEYPYFISEKRPLVLKIHIPPDGKLIKASKGFVYVVDGAGFKNSPKGSWQFVKKAEEVEFNAVVETEDNDFQYPVDF